MKVYVITKGSYSGYHICGVSLDKEEAKKIEELVTPDWEDGMVEEYDTESFSPFLQGGKLYRVRLIENDEIEVNEDADYEYSIGILNKVKPMFHDGWYYVYVLAKDEDHARQIGADIMFQYKYEKDIYGETIYDKQ